MSRGLAVTRWQRLAPREHALEALRPRPGARADECQHRMHVVEAAEAVVDAGRPSVREFIPALPDVATEHVDAP